MLDLLERKFLTDIAQAVCCMAKTVNATLEPIASVSQWTVASPENTVAYTPSGFPTDTLFTSIEVENFSDTYWLKVEPLGMAGAIFWVPPGGTKVIALSAPLIPWTGDISVYDAFEGTLTVPSPGDVDVQVTLLKGS